MAQACSRTGNRGVNVSFTGGYQDIRIHGHRGRRRRRRARSVRGRPCHVVAERACLVVLSDLVGAVEDRARALDDSCLRSFEARRRHASSVRRGRTIGHAEPILGNAIEAEGRVYSRAGNQISFVHVCANGRQLSVAHRLPSTPHFSRSSDKCVIENSVDIDEVDAVRNVEAVAVGVVAVGGKRARRWSCPRSVPNSSRARRVRLDTARSCSTRGDIGIASAETGRPVRRIALERMRMGTKCTMPPWVVALDWRSPAAAVTPREHERCHYNEMK